MANPPAIANRLNPNRSEDLVALGIVQNRSPSMRARGEENDWVIGVRGKMSEMPTGATSDNEPREG